MTQTGERFRELLAQPCTACEGRGFLWNPDPLPPKRDCEYCHGIGYPALWEAFKQMAEERDGMREALSWQLPGGVTLETVGQLVKERDSLRGQVEGLRKALLELTNELPDECICHESYRTREKSLGYRFKDPDCLYCDLDDVLKQAGAALAETGKEQG